MPSRVGFRRRALALIIDLSVVLLVSLLFGPWLAFRLGMSHVGGMGPGAGGMMAAAMAGSALIGLLYFASEAVWGYTPGKRVLGIQIGTDDGFAAPRDLLVLRWALKNAASLLALLAVLVSLALPGLGGLLAWLHNLVGIVVVGGCFLALGQSRQALHDRIAGTAVYPRGSLPAFEEDPHHENP